MLGKKQEVHEGLNHSTGKYSSRFSIFTTGAITFFAGKRLFPHEKCLE